MSQAVPVMSKDNPVTSKDNINETVSSTVNSIEIPHGTWIDGQFQKQAPEKAPVIDVRISIQHSAHKVMGKHWSGPKKDMGNVYEVKGNVADTGAQTITAGLEILSQLRCNKSYLLKTRHRINGITADGLGVQGALMVNIEAGGRQTRQIIYICDNIKGIYLSLTALKELGVVPIDFPIANSFSTHSQGSTSSKECTNLAKCGCPKRESPPALPTTIPYEPIEENKERLKDWILEHYAASAFNVCPHQPLQSMKGPVMNIAFREDYTPVAVHRPIPVPHHWKKAVKEGLDKDVELGIIEPVQTGTPTKWCSRMVIMPKEDGSPRRTVDLQELNAATYRETHHTPPPFHQVSAVPTQMKKSVLDAWNGYHSVPLAVDAQDATTFITEWGRYKYLRAPMGFHGSNDGYTKRYDEITEGEERVTRCVDDSLLWDTGIEQSFWHVLGYIQNCAENGVVFNPKKFKFGEDEVEFAGFLVTMEGVKPPTCTIDAIRNFPTPSSLTDLRSWFGLVAQVAYTFAQAELMAPFRELLASKHKKFYWDATLSTIFDQSKQKIIEKVCDGVKMFDSDKVTCISTDWCKQGISYGVTQKYCRCPKIDDSYYGKIDDPNCGQNHWQLIYAGSRFTTSAERNYAPIEGEALALSEGLNSCRMFTLGCPNLIAAVDHKPLVKIFNRRPLEEVTNPRVQKFKENTLKYQYKIIHVPGKAHIIPDTLSRYPSTKLDKEGNENDLEAGLVSSIMASLTVDERRAVTWEEIVEAARTDEVCILLIEVIQNGFPENREELHTSIRNFWPMRNDMYVVKGVPFKEGKMLIPKVLRPVVIESIHEGHQGVNAMRLYAKQRMFWPGLDADIAQVKRQCAHCNEISPSQAKEPMGIPPEPEVPFQQAVTDFFEMAGNDYLVYADRYSGWTEVAQMHKKTAAAIIIILRRWFIIFGVPEELASDGGPPFKSSEYMAFLAKWGVRPRLSSAYYPQSNGRAELAVKAVKRILGSNLTESGSLDTEAVARSFLLQRNTPVQDIGQSPAQMLYGHNLKDHLPTPPNRMRQEWSDIADAREHAMLRRHMRDATRYNTHTKSLESLQIGDVVAVQNQSGTNPLRWQKTGVVVEGDHEKRQYHVKVDGSRRVTVRNRRFLKKIDPVCRNRQLPDVVMQDHIVSGKNTPHALQEPNTTVRVLPVQECVPNVPPPTHAESCKPVSSCPPKQIPIQPVASMPRGVQVEQHEAVETPRIQQQTGPAVNPRRSTREKKETQRISMNMKGKSYY